MCTFWLIYLAVLYPNLANRFSFELANCCMKFTYSFKYIAHVYCCYMQVRPFFIQIHYPMFISNAFSFLGRNQKEKSTRELPPLPPPQFLSIQERNLILSGTPARFPSFLEGWKKDYLQTPRAPNPLRRLESGNPSRSGDSSPRTKGSLSMEEVSVHGDLSTCFPRKQKLPADPSRGVKS